METVDEATATVDAAATATTNTTTNAIDTAPDTDVAGETAPAEESKMQSEFWCSRRDRGESECRRNSELSLLGIAD